MKKYTILHFNEDFPDDAACLDYIKDQIYPDGTPCRKCGGAVASQSHIETADLPEWVERLETALRNAVTPYHHLRPEG